MSYYRICYYANFLKQSLTLGMFVPVDSNGNVLEEPKQEKYGWFSSASQEEQSRWMYEGGEEKYHEALSAWEKAKEKVLFEGFEIIEKIEENYFIRHASGSIIIFFGNEESGNIEGLLSPRYEIEITPAGLKVIGI